MTFSGGSLEPRRQIRLARLIPRRLDLADRKKISFDPAVELSYLTASEQRDFLRAMEESGRPPPLAEGKGRRDGDAYKINGERAETVRLCVQKGCGFVSDPRPSIYCGKRLCMI